MEKPSINILKGVLISVNQVAKEIDKELQERIKKIENSKKE